MKKVSNPLTIIAIFATIAETISGAVISLAQDEKIVVYFLVGFPVLLVILFFATLNFNSRVLYSPSDFKDDRNYLESLDSRKKRSDKYKTSIEELKGLFEPLDTNDGDGKNVDIKAVRDKIFELEHTNNSQENARLFLSFKQKHQNELLIYIKEKIKNSKISPMKVSEIEKDSSFTEQEIQVALDYLENEWIVSFDKENKTYSLV